MNAKIILAVIAALIIGAFVGFAISHSSSPSTLGGTVNQYPSWYYGGINVGKLGPNQNQVNDISSGSFSQDSLTLGKIGETTSTATTTATISDNQLAAGDVCMVANNEAPTSSAFSTTGQIVSASGGSATLLVTYTNFYSAAVTVVTGTTRYSCLHTQY